MLVSVIWHEEVIIINAACGITYKVLKTKTLIMNQEPTFEISVIVLFFFCNEKIDRNI